MANQPESASYDVGVYQLEVVDSVDGGVGAKSNAPLLSLANRTAYLKQHMDALESGAFVPNGIAMLASPIFTGIPAAPTQTAGDNATRLATTAFVQAAVNGTSTVSIAGSTTTTLSQSQYGCAIINLTGTVTANKAVVFPNQSGHWQVINNSVGAYTITLKTAAGLGVVLTTGMSSNIYCDGTNIALQQTDFISPALTGTPTAPTATAGTNTTQIATTAFVAALGALKANLSSPTFTGVPSAPTPVLGSNSTQLATTAFVQAAVGGLLTKSVAGGSNITLTAVEAGNSILSLTGALTANIAVIVPTSPTACWIVKNGTSGAFTVTVKTAAGSGILVTQGMSAELYCDGTNVYLQQTDFISPALTGTPTAPTATAGTNTTQIATTAFVAALGALKANLSSPTFTGVPSAPTAAPGTTTNQIATMSALDAAITALGSSLEAKHVQATTNIDMLAGAIFTLTINSAKTLTVSNPPSTGIVGSFILEVINGSAFAVTWWAGIDWAGSTPPVLTLNGKDVLGFYTWDGGINWVGMMLAKDVK